jgi:hypothetical protein
MMATCKLCHENGWLLSVNADRLCKVCATVFYQELGERMRIIKSSQDVISKSSNLDTILSRLDLCISHFKELGKYSSLGIPTVRPPPTEAIVIYEGEKSKIATDLLNKKFLAARDKSHNSKTLSGKIGPLNKVLEAITKYQLELDDVTELERLEVTVRHEVANVIARHYMEEANKADFKGQKKKAIDQYLEALYAMLNDPIPDEIQKGDIELAKRKIVELGGTVPSSIPPKK